MEDTYNFVTLCGIAVDEPALSHETHGQRFFRFSLRCMRLSGQEDVLPIILPEANLRGLPQPLAGKRIMVEGQLRSFNNKGPVGPRLVISVYARVVMPDTGPDTNIIRLRGSLCKSPVLRRTPLGRYICDMMLAVNRRYGRADYLPCIAWGQVAAETGSMEVGDTVSLIGRVQSRTYTKLVDGEAQEHIAYEVSIMELVDPEQ